MPDTPRDTGPTHCHGAQPTRPRAPRAVSLRLCLPLCLLRPLRLLLRLRLHVSAHDPTRPRLPFPHPLLTPSSTVSAAITAAGACHAAAATNAGSATAPRTSDAASMPRGRRSGISIAAANRAASPWPRPAAPSAAAAARPFAALRWARDPGPGPEPEPDGAGADGGGGADGGSGVTQGSVLPTRSAALKAVMSRMGYQSPRSALWGQGDGKARGGEGREAAALHAATQAAQAARMPARAGCCTTIRARLRGA